VHGHDEYRPDEVDYAMSFRPPPGVLKTLPRLKVVFSLAAGVDGFLLDPDYPRHVPLVRFVDATLSDQMAEYVTMHVLIHHRLQRMFDAAQQKRKWAQTILSRATQDTHVGIMGLGEIGTVAAGRLHDFGFAVSGWSRGAKNLAGVRSFSGDGELPQFLGQSHILVCLLPLTSKTKGILNATTFAMLPKDAYVINVARGGHLIEPDLIAALDSGHLAGATLDVFETEPLPETSPLWRNPKITVTPHIAAISDPRLAARHVIDGIARAERGERHPNTVDMTRGY
jgi:glyoxylate/hydroxypyruvate reductase A